jgi:hypothetical protein
MKKNKNIEGFKSFEDLMEDLKVIEAPNDFTQNFMRKFEAKLDKKTDMNNNVLWVYLSFLSALSLMSYFLVGPSSVVSLNGRWLNDLMSWFSNLDFSYDPITLFSIIGIVFVFFVVSVVENYSSINYTLAK